MSKDRAPKHEGVVPKSGEYVSGPGGPTMTQGGVMPGGPEMEGWKRPVKQEALEPEESLEEQAENVRRKAEDAKRQ